METIFAVFNNRIADTIENQSGLLHLKQQNVVELGRDTMINKASVFQQFLHHHLSNQIKKTSKPKAEFIRYRQIIQHLELVKIQKSPRHLFILNLLKKVWMEMLFTEFIEDFQESYFKNHHNLKLLKVQVADRYLFELYQLKQFIEAGMVNLQGKKPVENVPLSAIFMLSDEVLFHIINNKEIEAKNYQKSVSLSNIEFSRIKERKQKYNLLQAFPSKCLSYIRYANKDFIFQDIIYLLNEALSEQTNYKNDMTTLFGPKILCDVKVKKKSNGFDATGIRRVLVKWVENLIDADPQLNETQAFYNFIKNKKKVYDSFYIRSGPQSLSCHYYIIDILLDLLISAVFVGTEYNKHFGLFIYDLLRSKLQVESVKQIEECIQKLQASIGTIRKTQIFRIKNRLSTHNRDVLINFKYGNLLAAQIQICLGLKGNQSEKLLKKQKYEYKHFLYQLSRSIFGPTIELIILYEDHHREIKNEMYSIGEVSKHRQRMQKGIEMTDFKCHSQHEMIRICGDIFKLKKQLVCRSCFKSLELEIDYVYCYKCTIFYCNQCNSQTIDLRSFIGKNSNRIVEVRNEALFLSAAGFKILFFHLSYSPASILMDKYINYLAKHSKKQQYEFYKVDVQTNPQFFNLALKLGINKFPSFILYKGEQILKSKHKINEVLIGASIYKLFDFINVVKSNSLIKKCPQQHDLFYQKPAPYVYWKCCQCMKQKSSTQTEEILFCRQCLYCCCKQCGFIQTQITKYQDIQGTSYLSTSLYDTKPIKNRNKLCTNSHEIQFTRVNQKANQLRICSKCNTQFYFIKEFGWSECKKCNEVVCNKCTGIFIGIIDHFEFANHVIFVTANQIPPCRSCKLPYKKTYFSPKGKRTWQCFVCFQLQSINILHLSCYKCQINVCLNCIKNTEKLKLQQQFEGCCKCTGSLVLQDTLIKKSDLFKCIQCKKCYYINSRRYICKNKSCIVKKRKNKSNAKNYNYYCQSCVLDIDKAKKHKLLIICIKEQAISNYKIRQIEEQFLITEKISNIENRLISRKIITNDCQGRFKLQKSQFAQNLDKSLDISTIKKYDQIYYFETVVIQDILKQLIDTNLNTKHFLDQLIPTQQLPSSHQLEHKQIDLKQISEHFHSQVSQQISSTQPFKSKIIIKQTQQQLKTKNEEKRPISQETFQNPFLAALMANIPKKNDNEETQLVFNVLNKYFENEEFYKQQYPNISRNSPRQMPATKVNSKCELPPSSEMEIFEIPKDNEQKCCCIIF